MNQLYYGDNLQILREYLPDETVDLIYLDPPFNSARNYNVLFKDEKGAEAEAQITAFKDTWHWDIAAEATYHHLLIHAPPHVSNTIEALRAFVGSSQMMAYLVMMTARLLELHRVLKPTGSLYLHCDPTASHYLKILLDAIFGLKNFKNEIVWKRQSAHSDAKNRFPNVADVILSYGKSSKSLFKPQYLGHNEEYVRKFYRFDDQDGRGVYQLADMSSPNPRPNMMYEWRGFSYPAKGWRYQLDTMQQLEAEGRIWYPTLPDGSFDFKKRPRLKRYLNEQAGSIVTNIWTDIQPLHEVSAERLGYPTQKPLALLERIILASSHEGDVVLDPFCGCGTAVAAAQKLGRRWLGIDITHLAIALQKYRLKDMFGLVDKQDYQIIGEPTDVASARQLAQDNRYQFQWWALSLVQARPLGGEEGSKKGKKGSDKGIDGLITFVDEAHSKAKKVLVQVKSGKVKSGDVRDLRGTLEREKAAIAIFITLEPPTKEMKSEAATAGFYTSPGWQKQYPVLQILTIEELLGGVTPQIPPSFGTFKQAGRVKEDPADQQDSFEF